MNANAFRHFYDYHFAQNRKIWNDLIMPLDQTLFVQEVDYSMGSVRNQIIHLISVDKSWFSGLRGVPLQPWLKPEEFNDKDVIRAHWDPVEQNMRDYLATVTDEMLFEHPFPEDDEDRDLVLWQVLLHVANHGTDHRAQILRLLHDLGVKTPPQDYVFYIYDNPM